MCQRRRKMAWILGASVVIAAGLGYANYSWYRTVKLPYEHIANARITALDATNKHLLGQDLWKGTNGAVIMVEASGLSSLKPELDNLGVKLVGVVHERLGSEEFKQFFHGPLFLDQERTFYGPKERRMGLSGKKGHYFAFPVLYESNGFLRFGVWRSAFRAKGKGIVGNFQGEGRILGRLLVVNDKKGIIFQYDEKEFGDHADLKDVLDAAKQLSIV